MHCLLKLTVTPLLNVETIFVLREERLQDIEQLLVCELT